MARGGARNRSGPQPDPKSARSERRGVRLSALPAEGHDGAAPDWPLSPRVVKQWESADGVKYRVTDGVATRLVAEREAELWEWAWRTPQACAWSQRAEAWRIPIVAMWVRTFVVCESDDATAADKGSLHRFADQIGMTPAGLRENGWAIASDELGAKRAEQVEHAVSVAPVRRLRDV